MIDKRAKMMNDLYQAHCKLLDAFHSSTPDNVTLLNFCNLYSIFINGINPRTSSKRDEYIFTPNPNLNNKAILNAHLIVANEYAITLSSRIRENPNLDYSNELIGVVFDYPILLRAVEKLYQIKFGDFAGARNMKVDSYTSFKIADQIFWHPKEIRRSSTLNGYAIFALRQAIELAGKELIGLKCIENSDGSPFIYGSQIPWDFIVQHRKSNYFNFKCDPLKIQRIFKWSNHFVHTGFDAYCFATALALVTVRPIYRKKWIVNSFNQKDACYANEINGYAQLKMDFDLYLSGHKIKNLRAKWLPTPTLSIIHQA